jgi:hypothetical protein
VSIDKTFIEEQVNTVVTQNTVPEDVGVAIWVCGQANPPFDWAEQFIQVGECAVESEQNPSAVIDAQGDVLGELTSILQTLQDSEVDMPDTE